MGVWFCRFEESSRGGGGSTRQPQRTEPCQCVSGQPWACHGALQGQMQLLQCALGAVIDLKWGLRQSWAGGRWWWLRLCWFVEISRGGSARQPQRTELGQCVNGQHWACQGTEQDQVQPLQYAAGVVGPALGAAAGPDRWFEGLRFCWCVGISRGGGSTRQPQRTEPCQCVSG